MAGVNMASPSSALSAITNLTLDLLTTTSPPPLPFTTNETLLLFDQHLSTTTTQFFNDSNTTWPTRRSPRGPPFGMQLQIPVCVIIFLLSVVGNVLVMVTLIQNKKMRTVTNVFLLNLAVSDLLLAVFCMPFTIIPLLMRNFVFGAAMCVMIRYLQGPCPGGKSAGEFWTPDNTQCGSCKCVNETSYACASCPEWENANCQKTLKNPDAPFPDCCEPICN